MQKRVLIILTILLLLVSCEYGNKNLFYSGNNVNKRQDELQDMGKLSILDDGRTKYSIIVFTDIHFGSKLNTPPIEEFFAWLDKKQAANELPKMCLSLGDDCDHGYESEMKEYKVFQDRLESYGIPVFNTVGNHDLYNSGWKNWIKYAKQGLIEQESSFYKFNTEKYSWYTVDSGSTVIGENQLNNLKEAFLEDSAPKVIFSHYPLYLDSFLFGMADTTERNELITLFNENNIKFYVAGHVHIYSEQECGRLICYTVPSITYKRQWAEITIDEDQDTYSFNLIDAE